MISRTHNFETQHFGTHKNWFGSGMGLAALALAVIVAAAGCKSSWRDIRRDPDFHPTPAEPIRVAVLPFEDKSGGTSVLYYPFIPFIYLANLVLLNVPEGPPDTAAGAQTLQSLTIAKLGGSPIRVVSPRAVLTTLAHKGILADAYQMDPVELGKILGVDAILYGELLDWSGHYYVVQSETVVEAKVRLVSTLDRKELFAAHVGVTDDAGITGGPTGYVSAAATPVAALGSGPYGDLAVAWSELLGVDKILDSTASRPGDSSIAAANAAPFVSASAVAPAPNGGFKPGDYVEVVALGASGCAATFDLGRLRRRIPMVESVRYERDTGEATSIYRGNYCVSEADRFEDVTVSVTLQSRNGLAIVVADGEPLKTQQ